MKEIRRHFATLSQDASRGGFGEDLGRILEGFPVPGCPRGGFGEDLGRILGGFCKDLGGFRKDFTWNWGRFSIEFSKDF